MIKEVKELSEDLKPQLIELSNYIFDNPELGYEEFKACSAHVALLKKFDFEVEEGYMNIKTAFKAVYDSKKPGPVIAFLSEYDALPGLGHGCGHNLLGATNTGAGIVLSKLIKQHDLSGKVVVYGTPAEETSGAKVAMADNGAFSDVDIALEVHPGSKHTQSGTSLAMEAIEFTFRGKTSHAAAAPEKGINALDAAIQTFVNIGALRQHILTTSRIHGVIIEGGKAANIVPDLAIAQFYVRATTKTYLLELVEKVKNCATAAALATGAKLEIRNYEASYDNLVTNQKLSETFTKRLKDMGVSNVYGARESFGSLDIGNVSQLVPTIHPYFSICEEDHPAHTVEFRDATKTQMAYDSMASTIGGLVLTAYDVLTDSSLLDEIKNEFVNTEK
ncbi:M20 family metallopeptidase [Alkaliphilus peptidifermentans]|uniref:Peptidase M20 domain-containing protein 2 n=1 Tax=Alkaliphilus peptidifermentans DSM 18978 TaxID=1120976 RepID=A0A1G5KBX7_9FIRM|nr:M20 family metallopeptidase [Alkaliphilus peptidifermentans]SCY97558.1 amidohydrolase [Alkaliphilus peptidifermentans DSM 18978]